MATIYLDEIPNDDGWKFDPENPPATWTREMFGRLSLGDILRLEKADNGILSPESQASFDRVHAEWRRDLSAKLKPLVDATMPKIKMPDLVSPALRESIRQTQQNIAGQLDISRALGVSVTNPAWDWETVAAEPIRRPVVPVATLGDDFVAETSSSIEHLTVLQSIADIMVEQARAGARGATFYVVVGIATTLAGFASLVTMSTWSQRYWTIGLTVAAGAVAWAAHAIVKRRQRRNVESEASTGSAYIEAR